MTTMTTTRLMTTTTESDTVLLYFFDSICATHLRSFLQDTRERRGRRSTDS